MKVGGINFGYYYLENLLYLTKSQNISFFRMHSMSTRVQDVCYKVGSILALNWDFQDPKEN